MSSVLGTEKDTSMSRPLEVMVEKSPCNSRMFPLWEGEVKVIEKSST